MMNCVKRNETPIDNTALSLNDEEQRDELPDYGVCN